jgi:hypothetical protein
MKAKKRTKNRFGGSRNEDDNVISDEEMKEIKELLDKY